MLNALYQTAERLGVEVLYDAEVVDLDIADGFFLGAQVKHGGQRHMVRAGASQAAAGGFEANIDWLKEYWGRRRRTSSSAARRPTTAAPCCGCCWTRA